MRVGTWPRPQTLALPGSVPRARDLVARNDLIDLLLNLPLDVLVRRHVQADVAHHVGRGVESGRKEVEDVLPEVGVWHNSLVSVLSSGHAFGSVFHTERSANKCHL